MGNYNNQLQSFNKWPKQIKQIPEELVPSGFYYQGVGNYVYCFYCRLGVHEWEPYDIVNFKHCSHLDSVSNI